MGDARPMLDPMRGPLARALRRVRGPAAHPGPPADRAGSAPVDEGDTAIIARAAPYTMTGDAACRRWSTPSATACARGVAGRLRRVRRLARRLGAGDDPHAPGAGRRGPRHPPLRHLRGHDRAHRARRLADRSPRRSRPGTAHGPAAAALGGAVRPRALQRGRRARDAARHRLSRASACTSSAGPSRRRSPRTRPSALALLRLDTDWYESTRHELVHLYPRLSDGGVLIVDDYGHWEGARRAVDEYFGEQAEPLLLNRIDYTGPDRHQALSRRAGHGFSATIANTSALRSLEARGSSRSASLISDCIAIAMTFRAAARPPVVDRFLHELQPARGRAHDPLEAHDAQARLLDRPRAARRTSSASSRRDRGGRP